MSPRIFLACVGVSLLAAGCHRESDQTRAVPQLLRYRWVAGSELHYTMTTVDPNHGKPFTSERVVDVTFEAVKEGHTIAQVRLGCRNGVCVPQFATIPLDGMGEMPDGVPNPQFPVFQLPRDSVLPGATWSHHQILEKGTVLDSRYQFIGLRKIGNQTLAEIDDRFVLSLKTRKCPGTRSLLLNLSDGTPWQSTAKSEAEVTWQRI